ncbi:membrane transport protein [Anaerotignum neopropionicum]|uniref:Membrane transport protein n=1 Tax=Anaerotignum neopropionicum TaxID=36847 RepID=A0A136WFW5_9FIRM|nr:AEC family transporter [Anaerotignum neopropionicum]KXL53259.1 membrane transport protein [Anaerotignum neopropionicum]
MEVVLTKAFGFLFMIAMGFGLKRGGLFSQKDTDLLTRLVMKITLPMVIISNFRTLDLNISFLMDIGLGFFVNFVTIGLVLFLTRKKQPAERAFFIINGTGYNIGLCTLPFMQSFFEAESVAIVCMFDVGNAIMVFGVTFTVAMLIAKGKGNVSGKEIAKTLFSSMPFVAYLVMISLCILGIHLPNIVFDFAGMIGQANTFLAMILIGIMFEPRMKKSVLKDMGNVFVFRIVIACVFSYIIYHYLPGPMLHRQILSIVVFSPILSIAPIYTERCGYDRSAAAVLNSLMLPISLILMTILLIVLKLY